MAIREGLLALLERGPRHGYQLRAEFEASTGAAWPLNIGQVYTTLSRLERDGLVASAEAPGADGRVPYRITEAGREELARWFAGPVDRAARPRDALVIKLALALSTPGVNATTVIDAQRVATIRVLQDLTRQKARLDLAAEGGIAGLLVLESAIFAAEAEVRWLDHCEATLARTDELRNRPRPPTRP
jgi:DNA-binding PadR family transcriptional regulator